MSPHTKLMIVRAYEEHVFIRDRGMEVVMVEEGGWGRGQSLGSHANVYLFPSVAASGQYPSNRYQPPGRWEQNANNSNSRGVSRQSQSDDMGLPMPIFQQHGIPPEAFLPPGKVQPPLPPPPPPKPVGWECPVCTFINKPTRPGCEQCSGPRPEDYKVPNDASLDDREKREAELLIQVMSD